MVHKETQQMFGMYGNSRVVVFSLHCHCPSFFCVCHRRTTHLESKRARINAYWVLTAKAEDKKKVVKKEEKEDTESESSSSSSSSSSDSASGSSSGCALPPPLFLCRPKFQPPQSEGASRGLVPLGDQETGEQTFCCPYPPPNRNRAGPKGDPPPPRPQHALAPSLQAGTW